MIFLEIIFRKATEKDIAAVEKIYVKIHEAEKSGKLTVGWLEGVYPVRETAEKALAADELFIAESDGITVASAILNHYQPDGYDAVKWQYKYGEDKILVMHTLTVDPEYTGNGIGSKFTCFYEKYAKETGCLALRIDTQEKNSTARNMYKKLGFNEVGTTDVSFNGIPSVHLVLLEKDVG